MHCCEMYLIELSVSKIYGLIWSYKCIFNNQVSFYTILYILDVLKEYLQAVKDNILKSIFTIMHTMIIQIVSIAPP